MSAESKAPVRVDVWSDIACPWCAIGTVRLDAAIAEVSSREDAPAFDVRYHAYLLDPDAAPTDLTHAEDLARRKGLSLEQVTQMHEHVRQSAAGDGIAFDFDAVKPASTRKGHELIALAAERGRQREAVRALHDAYFVHGRRVDDLDTLVDIGTGLGLGLQAGEIRDALETGALETRVDIDLDEARRLGVQGVPFYVFDAKYAFSGAQQAEQIVRVIDHVAAEASHERD
ncbi:DsbA family oxidoreductase [Pseudoclavibacter endophyticus]|nr:DsbA family oxidoreductase [Pseudoclavibacter endophyticus]